MTKSDTDRAVRLGTRTVADFGDQWTRFTDNVGWYGSIQLFRDYFGPLLGPDDLAGCRVAEIGSGTGRVVNWLLEAEAAHVTALEPSDAFLVLESNVRHHAERVDCQRRRGDEIDPTGAYDWIFSIGVLHHIPNPEPVVKAAFAAVRPGGRMAVWVYGREGNALYLALVGPLRWVTTRLPHPLLSPLSGLLTAALSAYTSACRILPLPLRGYMRNVIANLDWRKRYLVVYDQLNPAYSKYYRRQEAYDLLARAGFVDIALYHRHHYSWAAVGRRPMTGTSAGPSKG